MPLSDLWKPLFAVLIIASLSACLAAHSWWLSALLFSLLGIECFIFPEDLLGFGKQFWGHRYNKHLFMLLIIALLSAYLAPHCWWLGALLLLLWLVIEGFIFWKNLWVPVSWKFFSCDEFLYGLLLLVLLIALVDRINDFGWFKHLEATFFDSFSRTRNHTMNAPIFIVEITDGDYTNFFCGKSPLKPGPMLTLIRVIRRACPAVIGVDLDTRDASWAKAELWKGQSTTEDDACAEQAAVPKIIGKDNKNQSQNPLAEVLAAQDIIWAEVPYEPNKSGEKDPTLTLDCVLGGELQNDKQIGIVRFPQDPDGLVRRHHSIYELSGSLPKTCLTSETKETLQQKEKLQPTAKQEVKEKTHEERAFDRVVAEKWWTVAKSSWPATSKWSPELKEPPADEEYIRFSSDHDSLQILQANQFLNKNGDEVKPKLSENEELLLRQLLRGTIVLIGGGFAAARDNYMTPLRELAGVELIANAIDSDLKPPILPSKPWVQVIDMFAGTWIMFIYFQWKDRPAVALTVSLLSMVVPPLVLAAFAFYWLGTWLNVAPVMAGMVIHQMLESAHRNRPTDFPHPQAPHPG